MKKAVKKRKSKGTHLVLLNGVTVDIPRSASFTITTYGGGGGGSGKPKPPKP